MATYEETVDEDVLPLTISAEDKLGETPLTDVVLPLTISAEDKLADVQPFPLTVNPLTLSFNTGIALEEAIQGAVQNEAGVGTTDYTDEANEGTIDDVVLLPDPLSNGDGFYVGSAHKFRWALFKIDTPGVGSYTIDWQYYNGTIFTDLNVIYDSTNDFKMTGMADLARIHAVVASDWEKFLITIGPISLNLYWFFGKIVTSATMTTRPLATQIWLGPRGGGQIMRIQIP